MAKPKLIITSTDPKAYTWGAWAERKYNALVERLKRAGQKSGKQTLSVQGFTIQISYADGLGKIIVLGGGAASDVVDDNGYIYSRRGVALDLKATLTFAEAHPIAKKLVGAGHFVLAAKVISRYLLYGVNALGGIAAANNSTLLSVSSTALFSPGNCTSVFLEGGALYAVFSGSVSYRSIGSPSLAIAERDHYSQALLLVNLDDLLLNPPPGGVAITVVSGGQATVAGVSITYAALSTALGDLAYPIGPDTTLRVKNIVVGGGGYTALAVVEHTPALEYRLSTVLSGSKFYSTTTTINVGTAEVSYSGLAAEIAGNIQDVTSLSVLQPAYAAYTIVRAQLYNDPGHTLELFASLVSRAGVPLACRYSSSATLLNIPAALGMSTLEYYVSPNWRFRYYTPSGASGGALRIESGYAEYRHGGFAVYTAYYTDVEQRILAVTSTGFTVAVSQVIPAHIAAFVSVGGANESLVYSYTAQNTPYTFYDVVGGAVVAVARLDIKTELLRRHPYYNARRHQALDITPVYSSPYITALSYPSFAAGGFYIFGYSHLYMPAQYSDGFDRPLVEPYGSEDGPIPQLSAYPAPKICPASGVTTLMQQYTPSARASVIKNNAVVYGPTAPEKTSVKWVGRVNNWYASETPAGWIEPYGSASFIGAAYGAFDVLVEYPPPRIGSAIGYLITGSGAAQKTFVFEPATDLYLLAKAIYTAVDQAALDTAYNNLIAGDWAAQAASIDAAIAALNTPPAGTVFSDWGHYASGVHADYNRLYPLLNVTTNALGAPDGREHVPYLQSKKVTLQSATTTALIADLLAAQTGTSTEIEAAAKAAMLGSRTVILDEVLDDAVTLLATPGRTLVFSA